MKTQIQNIVMSVNYEGVEFNLERLTKILDDAHYDPEVFPGIAYKSYGPMASFLIFSSGNMNCVGARSVKDAKLAIKKLTRKLRRAGIKIKHEPKTQVQNLVASFDFNVQFNLEKISRTFENTEYEPEVFPGLVYRLDDPKVVVLLFVSGKGVCAGAKNFQEIKRAGKRMIEILGDRFTT